MKKYLLLFACVIATSAIFAQNQVLDNNESETTKQGVEYSAKGMSASSAFLYLDLKQGEKNLEEKYDFVKVNGEWNVTAFVVVAGEKIPLLKNYGVILNDEKDVKFKSATIPVANFVAFVEDQVADFVDIGFKYDIKMDSARYYSNADIVQNGGGRGYSLSKGYCGKDVVVGIIDVGFDYTHRNFYDTTETRYRVKRVWDQNASGTAPSGFNYGNELTTQSAILAALYSHNNQTHGCHVAGIAGGGGANDNNTRKYRGMAPESDLVFVSTNGNSSRLYDGIKYVFAYAASVGKPCVVNLSWGGHVGPHDGTDAVDQNCDGYILRNYPEGSLIVISAGNEGSDKLHQSKTFSNNDSILRTFAVTTSYGQNVSSPIDFWGQVGNTFAVKVSVVDTQSRSIIGSTRFGMSSSTSTGALVINNTNCTIQYYIYPTHPYNNKPNITLVVSNANESNAKRKVMVEVIATTGTVHEWINDGYFSSCNYPSAVAGNTNYTINAFGQGDNQIMVASYTTRKYWRSAGDGYQRAYNQPTVIGGHSPFSSIGPSLTSGKIKPDISAPGSAIISSYNYGGGNYTTSNALITNSITNGNHSSLFGVMQGTSMAAPACAGILALWLEAYPQLTTSQVKWLFQNYSIVDNITGSIPSTGSVYYGRGKINALAGLQAILQKTAKPTITNSGANQICPGNSVTLSAPTGYAQYIWNTGETTRTITVSQAGSYYVRAVSAEGFKTPNSDTVRITYGTTLSTSIAQGNQTICQGQSASLVVGTAGMGTTYRWSTGATSQNITVAPNTTTRYWVTTNKLGYCPKTDTITVTVQPYLTTTVTNNPTICQGNSTTLTVSGGTSHTWSTGATTSSITVSPSSTTTYTVTSSQNGYCSKTDNITVTVQPYVTTTVSSNPTICQGQSATLTVSGGTSRVWSHNNSTANSVTVSPSSTTTYTVTSSESGKCSKTDNITVTVQPYVTTSVSGNQTICQGQSATLTVSGGTSRVWSHNNSTANSVTVTPSSTTTYTVTSSESGKCSKTDNITVTVQPYVTTTVSSNPTICQGQSATLTVSGGTSRVWSHNNSTANSVTVSPSSTTTYTVTSSESGKCSKTDNITVTVQPYVTTTVSGNQSICKGQSATLTVSGGTSHSWSTGASTSSITVSPSSTTTYTVTSSENGKCSKTDNITVTIRPIVTTTKSTNPTICQGSSATLTVNGGTSRVWSHNNSTANSVTVSPNSTTSYYVTSSESGKCDKIDTFTVTVQPYVTTTITPDTTICKGTLITLTVNGGTSRQWSIGSTARSIDVAPDFTTSYTVTSSQSGYCSTTDTVTVTVRPYVTTTKSSNPTICQGSSATLNVSGGTSRVWRHNNSTANSVTVSPNSTTSYYVTSSESGKCDKIDTFTVTVQPYVNTARTPNQTICQGGSATIAISGGTSRTWSTGQTTTSITVSPSQTTTYTVTSNENGKCSKTDTFTVTVRPYVTTTKSPNTTICQGQSATLTVSGGTYHSWDTGDTTRTITVTPNATTRYIVISSESGKCDKIDTITVTVQPYVTTTVSSNPTICQGSSATLTVSGGTSHTWSTSQTTQSITVTPSQTTSYTVVSSQTGKCSTTDTVVVTVQPYVTTTVTNNPTICQGQSATLNVNGGTSHSWSTGDTTVSITVTPNATTRYTVTSSESGKCSKTDSITVTVQTYVATSISNDTTICPGSPISLSVSGGTSRTWSTGDTAANITVIPYSAMIYTVTSSETGYCPTTDSVRVSLMPTVATIASRDTSICLGSSITLSVTGGTSRYWNTGDTTTTITLTPTSTATYTVVSEQSGLCSKYDLITVSVLPYVTTRVSGNVTICQGTSANLSVTGGDSWHWSNGATSPTISVSPNRTTSYFVTTDSVNRCSKTDTMTVNVNPLPNVVITGDTLINAGETTTLTATGAQSYLWSTGATTSAISVSPYITTNYSVTGTDANGCSKNAEIRVVVNTGASIADASDIDFKVYPIPTQTKLTVEADDLMSVTIYNLLGKKMDNIDTKGETSINIDVKDYAQGVYVIVVENSKGLTGRKTFIVR